MSGISSGIGLVTGIDSASLIDQLIALESRPILNLQSRMQEIDIRRTAFLQLSAQLLAIRNSVSNFNKPSFFRRFSATSSNEQVVTATAGENALPSTTIFRVRSLVASHSLITRGFASADNTPVGAGTITLEVGQGRVNNGTDLDILNGGNGIGRGVIRVTDRSGASADVDLTTALTVDDVLRAINNETGINVHARVTGIPTYDFAGNQILGDRLVIEDVSGGTGNLIITDVGGGTAATDLGIAANAAADRIDGHDLIRLTDSTSLALLNDGNGIGGSGGVYTKNDLTFTSSTEGSFDVSLSSFIDDATDLRLLNAGAGVRLGLIRVTDRAGNSVDVDLRDLVSGQTATVGEVKNRINSATQDAGVAVSISISTSSDGIVDKNIFIATDTSELPEGETGILKIEDVQGFTAADLGIAAETEETQVVGRNIYNVSTLGDVIRAINYAAGNSFVHASISDDGNGIVLSAQGFDNQVTVTTAQNADETTTTAARDLGIEGATFSSSGAAFASRPLIAGLNTVLLQTLNGGNGTETGLISITDRSGATAVIDVGTARTLQDVIDLINADGTTAISASVNRAGTGLQLTDASEGVGNIVINDVSGSLATDFGLAGAFAPAKGNIVDGGNAQRQYITDSTLLSSLNLGRGVSKGDIRVTTADGAVHIISFTGVDRTIGSVISRLNAVGLEARINDTGDGILVIDNTTGDNTLTIEDVDGGSTASDLRLAGSAAAGQTSIDGSFETRINIGAGDSLSDVAQKINDAGLGVSAAVLNSGSAITPFSLTLTSETAGRRGEMTVDTGGIDLGLQTLSRAQDAVVSIGDADGGTRLVTSSSNTLDNVVEGVTFDLLATSTENVTINVAQDVDAIVDSINLFVEQYNKTLDTIAKGDTFDQETFQRGPLFGDFTIDQVESRLRRTVLGEIQGVDQSFSRLFSVGLRLVAGSRLEFNEEDFREAYERSPQKVEDLFMHDETGFGTVIQQAIDNMTDDFDGLLTRKDQLLEDQKGLLNDRIDQLNILIDAKRARLEAQFVALESAVAGLQGQQNALANLQILIG